MSLMTMYKEAPTDAIGECHSWLCESWAYKIIARTATQSEKTRKLGHDLLQARGNKKLLEAETGEGGAWTNAQMTAEHQSLAGESQCCTVPVGQTEKGIPATKGITPSRSSERACPYHVSFCNSRAGRLKPRKALTPQKGKSQKAKKQAARPTV